MAKSNLSVELKWQSGESDQSLLDFIAKICMAEAPLLHWLEPRPGYPDQNHFGPWPGFTGLGAGAPDIDGFRKKGRDFSEARLFYQNKALHVLAAAKGRRWSWCEECEKTPAPETGRLEVIRAEKPVFLFQDHDRYGLPEAWTNKLRAIEYRNQGRLVAWRLLPFKRKSDEGKRDDHERRD
jgi:hypothetical protein